MVKNDGEERRTMEILQILYRWRYPHLNLGYGI